MTPQMLSPPTLNGANKTKTKPGERRLSAHITIIEYYNYSNQSTGFLKEGITIAMERGSIIDAEIELRDQVSRLNPFDLAVLYQEVSIDRNWRIIKELIVEARWKRDMAIREALMAATRPRQIFFVYDRK